jgi:acyl-CoA dehydrogenase
MDFRDCPTRRELQRRAAALARELMAHEDSCESQGGLPPAVQRELAAKARAAGLGAMNMPVAWGGAGLGYVEQALVHEELGQVTNGLWALVERPPTILVECNPEQRERYLLPAIRGERRSGFALTEPDAGSDTRAIATTAVPTAGGGFRLDGEKWFVTGGDVADFLLVLAAVEPGRRLTLFLMDTDRPGVEVRRQPRFSQVHVLAHPEIRLAGVEVGSGAVLGEVGCGFELARAWFTEERLLAAARCVGAARRALQLAADWAETRVQFGQPIGDHQLVQAMLADGTVDVALARSLLYEVAGAADREPPEPLLHARAAMVKLAASEAAGRVADRAVQIFGGRGCMREQPVERLYREIRRERILNGTSEIQRLIVAGAIRKGGLPALLALPDAGSARAIDD